MVKYVSLSYLEPPAYHIALRGIKRDIRAAKKREYEAQSDVHREIKAARRHPKGFLDLLQKYFFVFLLYNAFWRIGGAWKYSYSVC
jgi:hypothetical protein